MKAKEESNTIKDEVEILNKKLAEMDEKELSQVVGGFVIGGKTYSTTVSAKDLEFSI